ncbi:MAG: hypothetical protein GEU80_02100 [Dehalococcoidia bacterium]|nr:hypothetical protein [Dehalococcoidia bacterium]
MFLVGALALAVLPEASATSDYTPVNYGAPGMPNGGVIIDVNTNVDSDGTADTWNSWTGTLQLWSDGDGFGISGCGNTYACTVFADEGSVVTINGENCSFPTHGAWANLLRRRRIGEHQQLRW